VSHVLQQQHSLHDLLPGHFKQSLFLHTLHPLHLTEHPFLTDNLDFLGILYNTIDLFIVVRYGPNLNKKYKHKSIPFHYLL